MADIKNLKKLLKDKMSSEALENFLEIYLKYKVDGSSLSSWDSVVSPEEKLLPHYDTLPLSSEENIKKAFESLVVCKLNGGLGTTMGCKGPKSSIIVRDDLSFLDIIIRQLEGLSRQWKVSIPLVLMNSFYTHQETLCELRKWKDGPIIETFIQNKFPRLNNASGNPLEELKFGSSAWYPPGHGDFFHCVYHQGLLDKWLKDGKKILYISNSDNLGASIDNRIAGWMMESGCSFLMEVTPKTHADVKGGTLYQKDGRLRLLEVAQVPSRYMADFCNTRKFKVFNTNNIWINLINLKKRYKVGSFKLPVIQNIKKVDNVDVVQLETALGFGIENFSNSVGLVVPRCRYLPVKKTSDLFLVQSDLFVMEAGRLSLNPKRTLSDLPEIRFDSGLDSLADYNDKILEVPSIVDLKSLRVEGDVRFDKGIVMKGDVVLTSKSNPLTIAANTLLRNKEITS